MRLYKVTVTGSNHTFRQRHTEDFVTFAKDERTAKKKAGDYFISINGKQDEIIYRCDEIEKYSTLIV